MSWNKPNKSTNQWKIKSKCWTANINQYILNLDKNNSSYTKHPLNFTNSNKKSKNKPKTFHLKHLLPSMMKNSKQNTNFTKIKSLVFANAMISNKHSSLVSNNNSKCTRKIWNNRKLYHTNMKNKTSNQNKINKGTIKD